MHLGSHTVVPLAVNALAWLADRQLGAGQRLGVALNDNLETVALIQAAWLAGVVLVPFNRRLDAPTLHDQAARARLTRLVTNSEHPLAGHPLAEPFVMPARSGTLPPAPTDEHAEALVLFTSGTTGRAKAARIPRRAVRHALAASGARLGLGPQDIWLGCLPLDHIAGIGNVLRMLGSGYQLVQHPRFTVDRVNHAIDHDHVSGLSLVPTQLHRLIAARHGRAWPATLRTIVIGGAPLEPALRTACVALGVAPRQTYGLTECCAMVTCQSADSRDESAGHVLDGVELRTIEDRIQVRGPTLFLGYDDAPGGPDVDGWFSTGDHGHIDAAGRLTVFGRRDDLIISGGENVYPAQVEAVIRTWPGVAEALVIGLPDPEWGQIVAVALVPHRGDGTDFELRPLMATLPGPWRPRAWRWYQHLPYTALGKPDRLALRAEGHLFTRSH